MLKQMLSFGSSLQKRFALCWLCSLLVCLLSAQSAFVGVKDHQFLLAGQPYYYIGTNYWYGGLLGLQSDRLRGKERLSQELDFLHSKGVDNLRVVVGAEGAGLVNGQQRIGPPLQTSQGKFDETVMESLDHFFVELGKRNMKAVVYLSNNWEWSGGFLQYLNWNGLIPDSELSKKFSWDALRDSVSKFYSCTNCKAGYLNQVAYVLDRTNKISGKKYTDDPAIMAWELANEPRPMRPKADRAYAQWISDVADFIKSKDKNHLVTTGCEGIMGTESMDLFKEIHAGKSIDYLTIHIWPKNWSWFNDTAIQHGFKNVVSNTNDYIGKHEAIARALNKPLVIEEFGLPRNGQSFDVRSATSLRDSFYKNIFTTWQVSKENNGVIAGASFWAFGGNSRPMPGQVFWQKGNDYMGDPPMEEQGLNTVFDSDTSTWQLIESYAGNKAGLPTDKKATKETINLYRNLKKLLDKGIMFGHQDDLAYGVNWKYVPGRSDIHDVTGDYPAVYGWELGRLELDHLVNLDSVPFDKMKGFIQQVYSRGGINTISWHLNNPLTGKTAWDPAKGTVAAILPGGAKNDLYKSWLDKVAAFLLSLKGKNGELIPVIFRPYHELNGNWFWWGGKHCTPDEFRQLWQFTVSYLRDEKNVHNLLYAYNTDRFNSKEEYLLKYPGDQWTDVIGFDIYQREKGDKANAQFSKDIDGMLTTLETISKERSKIPALTEFGFGQVPDSTWWTGTLWKSLQSHKITYALAWRNAGAKGGGEIEYYTPHKGQPSENDFRLFFNEPRTLFQNDIGKDNVYGQ